MENERENDLLLRTCYSLTACNDMEEVAAVVGRALSLIGIEVIADLNKIYKKLSELDPSQKSIMPEWE